MHGNVSSPGKALPTPRSLPTPSSLARGAIADDEIARAAKARKGCPFLNTDQAAFYVGLSRCTFEKMRTHGRGPRFRKHGRYVRYHIVDLDAWSEGASAPTIGDA